MHFVEYDHNNLNGKGLILHISHIAKVLTQEHQTGLTFKQMRMKHKRIKLFKTQVSN